MIIAWEVHEHNGGCYSHTAYTHNRCACLSYYIDEQGRPGVGEHYISTGPDRNIYRYIKSTAHTFSTPTAAAEFMRDQKPELERLMRNAAKRQPIDDFDRKVMAERAFGC